MRNFFRWGFLLARDPVGPEHVDGVFCFFGCNMDTENATQGEKRPPTLLLPVPRE